MLRRSIKIATILKYKGLNIDRRSHRLASAISFSDVKIKPISRLRARMIVIMNVIEHVDYKHFDRIIELTNYALGVDYISYDQLRKYVEQKHFGFVMTENNKVVGFVINEVLSLRDLNQRLRIEAMMLSSRQFSNDLVGLLNAVVVDPEYRHKGIASILIESSISTFKTKRVKLIASELWKSPSGVVNAGKLFEKNQFKKVLEIKEYWKQESLREGFDCIACGFPCTCSAIIYVREL
jgi:ribosomal protein S18 acetylase RimI-like enzyme